MKRFDLTFSGKVLEEFEAEEVKRALSEMLEIPEPDELNRLFTGRSFILGQNLERKSAAELYSKFSSKGAEVQLVATGSGPADACVLPSSLTVEQTKNQHSEAIQAEEDTAAGQAKLWPVRGTKTAGNKKVKPSDVKSTGTRPTASSSSQLTNIRKRMQGLQQEMQSMKALARKESAKLQRRLEHFHRIAEREQEKIKLARLSTDDVNAAHIEELEEAALARREQAEQQIAVLQRQERETAQQSKLETDRLHGLILETEDEEQSALEQLDQERAEIRERTEARVQALVAQIEELESQASSELRAIEQRAGDYINSWKLERAALEREQSEIQNNCAQRLEWLREQQHNAEQSVIEALIHIEQQRAETRDTRQATLMELQAASARVTATLEHNLARARRADEKARESSKESLQALHARKLELQRLATLTMHEAGEKSLEETGEPTVADKQRLGA